VSGHGGWPGPRRKPALPRNHDTSGPPAVSVEPPELSPLRAAAGAYLARAGRHYRVVARAAQALDELREALAHADRLIAGALTRIGDVYDALPSEGDR
jgi:hypothetical protein